MHEAHSKAHSKSEAHSADYNLKINKTFASARNIPQELRERRIWMLWKKEARKDKVTKTPYQPSGERARVNDSSTWSSFDEVLEAYRNGSFDGIGAVVVPPYVFVDLDKCIDENGALKPYADEIVRRFSSYTEISPSGMGLHIICKGTKTPGRSKNTELGIEIYGDNRYFTFTGNMWGGNTEIRDNQEALNWLQHKYLNIEKETRESSQRETQREAPPHRWHGEEPEGLTSDDKIVLDRLRSRFPQAVELLEGGLGDNPSASERDLALCNYLARCSTVDDFESDPQKAHLEMEKQIIRIIRNSKANREKWGPEHYDHYIRPTVRKAVDSVMEEKRALELADKISSTGKGSLATKMFMWVVSNYELWHDQDYHSYITTEMGDLRVGGREFRVWLYNKYQNLYERTLPPSAFAEITDNIESRGLIGKKYQIHKRVAWHNGKIYLDLGHRYVEIDEDGWRVVDSVPVKFSRTQDMLPLPEPQPGGDWSLLLDLINADTESKWLILGWLMQGLWETDGHYCHLILTGTRGTGKTSCMEILKRAIDPSIKIGRSPPDNVYDLGIASTTERVLTFDNLSRIKEDFSDALCQASKGGAVSRRELYKSADEISFHMHFPAIITAIGLNLREDLLDRVILIELQPISAYISDEEMQARFGQIQPQILGLLCDAASAGLRNYHKIPTPEDLRVGDFCRWVCACAMDGGLPFTGEEFLRAYRLNRLASHKMSLNMLTYLLMDVVDRHINNGVWEIKSSELFKILLDEANKQPYTRDILPTTPAAFGRRMNREIPLLQTCCYNVELRKREDANYYVFSKALYPQLMGEGEEEGPQRREEGSTSSSSPSSCEPGSLQEYVAELRRTGDPGGDVFDLLPGTAKEIAGKLKMREEVVWRYLEEAEARGWVRKTGSGRWERMTGSGGCETAYYPTVVGVVSVDL